MSPKEVFSKLSLWIVNLYLNLTSSASILPFICTCGSGSVFWIRIGIRNQEAPEYGSNTDPIWIWLRIHNTVSDPVLRSHHFFGRLRLWKSEVPEPAPTKLGRLRHQAKKGGSRRLQAAPAPYTNSFHFELLNSEFLMQVFFGRSKVLLSNVLSQKQGFPFCLPKRCSWSRFKKGASGQQKIGSGSTLKVAAPGGSGTTTLFGSIFKWIRIQPKISVRIRILAIFEHYLTIIYNYFIIIVGIPVPFYHKKAFWKIQSYR